MTQCESGLYAKVIKVVAVSIVQIITILQLYFCRRRRIAKTVGSHYGFWFQMERHQSAIESTSRTQSCLQIEGRDS